MGPEYDARCKVLEALKDITSFGAHCEAVAYHLAVQGKDDEATRWKTAHAICREAAHALMNQGLPIEADGEVE